MTVDLLIKGGLIADGTGAKSFRGSVAVKDGKIVAVGAVSESADRVLDATGLVVAPGFWDFHTHLDLQLFWDPIATSSCWHGVTTVVTGNCGFSVAPCRPGDQDWMARMLARVEAMDVSVLRRMLPWPWESFGGYLAALDNALGVNVVSLVGHSAIRRYVMGPDSAQRAATEPEIVRMKQVLAESLAAGGMGFSTSRISLHEDGDGLPVPSRLASVGEYLALAEELAPLRAGYLQLVAQLQARISTTIAGPEFSRWTDEGMANLVELTRRSGRPVCWNSIVQAPGDSETWRQDLRALQEMRARGIPFFAMGQPQGEDNEFILEHESPFTRWPTGKKIFSALASSPLPSQGRGRGLGSQRVALMKDAALRDALKREIDADAGGIRPFRWDGVLLVRSATGRYRGLENRTMAELGAYLGKHPLDAAFDIALDEDLQTQFRVLDARNWDPRVVVEVLTAPHVIAGQSDAGAHQTSQVNTGFATRLLGYWVREKQALSLEEAVRRVSAVPAEEIGVTDRGYVKAGMIADLTIFNPDTVAGADRAFVNDLPGGGRRLVHHATGIEYTIVNGRVTLEGGKHSGALAGKTIRSGAYARV